MKKRFFALCLILNLTVLNLMLTKQVYAFNGAASFSAPGGTLEQGAEFSAVLSLSSDDGTAFYASGTVTSDPGLQILSVSGDGATVNGTRFIFMNPQPAFSVTVNVRAVGQGTQQLYVGDLKMAPLSDSDAGAGQNAPVSTSASVYIITDAEIEAIRQSSIEASRAEEESRSIEESMAASLSAEEASIAQSIAASEAESRSIEESIAASQAAEQSVIQSSIDESRAIEESIAASIAAIEDERRRSEAAEEASRNQSIQASIEAEEQSRRESENYEASVAASLEESRSIEEAARNSSSEEDVTSTETDGSSAGSEEYTSSSSEGTETPSEEDHHGTLYKDIYAVRLLARRKTFEFAVKDTPVKAPEGFTEAALEIKDEPVLAFKAEGMAEDTYLVYGYLGNDEKADFYYYDSTGDEWIAYDKIGSRPVLNESESKGEKDVKESTKETEASVSTKAANTVPERQLITKAAEAGVLSFILGVGITGIISMISMSRKEKQKEDEDTDLL